MAEDSWPPMSPEDLLETEGWQELPSDPDTRILTRLWPGEWVDTIVIHTDGKAMTQRTNPDGQPVWRHFAALSAAIVLVWTIPAPSEPGAPTEVLRSETIDRDV